MSILLSYNTEEAYLAEALRASLAMINLEQVLVFSPVSLGAVLFRKNIESTIYEAEGLVVLIGPRGLSSWQEIEYSIALDRHSRDETFPLVLVFAGETEVPRAAFSGSLNWIEAPAVTDRTMCGQLSKALKVGAKR